MMPVGSDAFLGNVSCAPRGGTAAKWKEVYVSPGWLRRVCAGCVRTSQRVPFFSAKFMALECTHKAVNWGRFYSSIPQYCYHTV